MRTHLMSLTTRLSGINYKKSTLVRCLFFWSIPMRLAVLAYTTSAWPRPFFRKRNYCSQRRCCSFLWHMARHFLGSKYEQCCLRRALGSSDAESYVVLRIFHLQAFAWQRNQLLHLTSMPTCRAWTGSTPIRLFCPVQRIYRPTRHLLWHRRFCAPWGLLKRRSCLSNFL